jgi:hypothetical protein
LPPTNHVKVVNVERFRVFAVSESAAAEFQL